MTGSEGGAPTATYRLQLRPGFGFDAARAALPRLRDLGVSHLYLSPVLQAAPGSTHGYDTVDHSRIDDGLGGRTAFDELAAAASADGMGLVVDVVPNHMSIAVPAANRWWWDVLEHGAGSSVADHFDITWESSEARQADTVLLPILGDHYGVVLEAGELVLERAGDEVHLRYFDHVMPLAPRSLATVLGPAGAVGGEEADRIDARLAQLNGDPDALHEVLEQQHYQLCHWRRAQHDLDYRRFFDVDTLIGLRIEDPVVFEETHRLILELVAGGAVVGLRIDHPDGLADPAGYLDELAGRSGGAWIVVEKILEPGEELPATWPVSGTTGYDLLRVVDGVFRSPTGVDALQAWWSARVDPTTWEDTVATAKAEILTTVLAADVARLADVGVRLCERHRRHRDHTRPDVAATIRAIAAAMPVYRTYVRPGAPASTSDRELIGAAVARADDHGDIDPDLAGFLRAVLSGDHHGEELADEFVERFQQLTGPTMAKSVEDTSFYRYLAVPSANEVGGDPGRPAVSVAELHAHNARIHREWPATMTALSTHDTKRSADVRSRLDALTFVPDRWARFAERWGDWAVPHWGVDPDPATTQLLLHTMVGAWPIDRDRLVAYLEKATKEAKRRTSWTDADPAFDDAVTRLAEAALADHDLTGDVASLVEEVLVPGRHIACARQLLQLTVPGVPDCYQGSELWDLSLVDPDNRRPVDHDLRRELAEELVAGGGAGVDLAGDDLGRTKLWITRQALHLRRRRPRAFGPGDAGRYVPIDAGPDAVAFSRGDDVVVATLRHPDVGAATIELPPGTWTELLGAATERDRVTVTGLALLERTGP